MRLSLLGESHNDETPTMRYARALTLVAAGAALALTGASGTAPAHAQSPAVTTATPVSSCRAAWRAVPTAVVGDGELYGVAAGSSRDAWAVGQAVSHGVLPLIEHWNGLSWRVVPSPGISEGGLNDVAVVSRRDAWAVGSIAGKSPLVMHWDGRRWSQVPAPGGAALYGVSATSGHDVWAVGGTIYSGGGVIAHWDGVRWTLVYQDRDVFLSDVVAISLRDVWAVGAGASLVMLHWDGRSWRKYTKSTYTNALDVDDPPISYLTSVAAVSSREVWAAGDGPNSQTDTPLLYRWNGKRWVADRPGGGEAGGLRSIAARSRDDVWGVGWFEDDESGPEIRDAVGRGTGGTLWHSNGRSWSVSVRPRQWLQAIATDGGTGFWAAGFSGKREQGQVPDAQNARPLILRYRC